MNPKLRELMTQFCILGSQKSEAKTENEVKKISNEMDELLIRIDIIKKINQCHNGII